MPTTETDNLTTDEARLHGVFAALPLTRLVESPTNPRRRFEDLDDLAASIRQLGVLEPLLVRPRGAPIAGGPTLEEVIDEALLSFEVLAGARRLRAARLAGLTHVPCLVRWLSDEDALEVQLVENLQRLDVPPLDEARGFRALLDRNPARYSAAGIAERIGRSVSYVWGRLKLLDAIPDVQTLLEQGRIQAGHAELLATLKPEDQTRAIRPPQGGYGAAARHSGLWQPVRATALPFAADPDDDARDTPAREDPYHDLKPVTVAELQAWISRHVRFDVAHAAVAAPLLFEATATAVEAAQAAPGRGKKVIALTTASRVDDDAKDPATRTYGAESWRRADGTHGSRPCDHRVLGVIVAGDGYGRALEVCIARDRCEVHWANEIKAREKAATQRAQGKGGQAAQTEAQARADREAKEQARAARRQAWLVVRPHLMKAAINQVRGRQTLTPALVKALGPSPSIDGPVCKHHGIVWWTDPFGALLASFIEDYHDWDDPGFDSFVRYVTPLGLDLKKLEAVRATHQPDAPAGATPAPARRSTRARGKATPSKGGRKARR